MMDTLFTRDGHGNLRLYDFEAPSWPPCYGQPTIRELADLAVARGALGTFDFALPIDWCDDVRAKTGESPFGFVWSYPETSIWGEPFALTTAARELLAKYKEALKMMTELETAFAAFGEPITIEQVADLVLAGRQVWSWGYGDSESEFTTIEHDDLWFINESPEDAEIAWGPFRLGPIDGMEKYRAEVAH